MPFGFFMDKWYLLLVVPALLVAAWAQYKVHATFKKYSQVGTQRGLTGRAGQRADSAAGRGRGGD